MASKGARPNAQLRLNGHPARQSCMISVSWLLRLQRSRKNHTLCLYLQRSSNPNAKYVTVVQLSLNLKPWLKRTENCLTIIKCFWRLRTLMDHAGWNHADQWQIGACCWKPMIECICRQRVSHEKLPSPLKSVWARDFFQRESHKPAQSQCPKDAACDATRRYATPTRAQTQYNKIGGPANPK